MTFEDHRDPRDGFGPYDSTLPETAGSPRSERALGILKDIARAIGITPAAFFTGASEMRDLAIADLCKAADLIAATPAGAPLARSLDVLRREAAATDPSGSDEPVPAS